MWFSYLTPETEYLYNSYYSVILISSFPVSGSEGSIAKDTSLIYINMHIEKRLKHNWELTGDDTVTIDLAYDYERVKLNRAFEHWHFLLNAGQVLKLP